MYRDRGPHHNLGYGIPIWGTPETEDGLPNSGAASPIQRLLHERPTLAFFTTAASSLVGMYVAGRVASKGGIRFAAKAQQLAKQETRLGRSIAAGTQSFRRIQAELDALEGISRRFVDDAGRVIPAPEDAFVIKHGDRWLGRKTIKRDGWSYRWDNPNVDPWTLRDEIQQRLVHQARRLPYELPAFYVLDKALINPLLGEDQGKRQPNWGNPFDVIGDFAWESVKNTAGYVLPFEAGSAATKQGFRNLMRGIETGATSSPGLVSLKATLELVGADATDLVNKGLRLSHQSLGAFSMMVQDAQDNSKTLDQFWKSHGRSAVTSPRREIGNASAARRAWERSVFRFKNQDLGKHAIDTMPGPFKGMGTAISRFKGHFKDIGQTYDDWQNIISGRTSITQLDDVRAERVRDFMKRGGGTYLEQFSQDVWRLGHGGPTLPNGTVNTQWKHGQFYRQRSQHVYDGLLIRALADNTGLKEEHALQFIRMSNKISPYAGGRGSEPYSFDNLIERIQFSRNQPHAKSIDEWWASLTRGISEHGIPFDPNKLTLESFKRSVKQADLKYSNEAFRELMDADLASQWKHLHGQVLPQIAGKSLASGRLPYSDFANANLGQDATRQFLIRRTAQRLGIDIVDAAGNQLPIDNLKQMIRSHGLNPSDPHKLRGFLIDQKDINVPWARGGGNIFGIRALSVQEAIDNGYFSGQPAEVQREMSYLVNQKTFAAAVGRGGNLFNHASDARKQTRMKGVYTNARGNVIDLGRVRRGIMASMDTFASEYKIPILNVNPLQVGFWNKYQAMRNASPINMLSPHSLQPGPIMGANSDFNLLIKTSATGTKGSVYGITGGAISGTQSRQIPGVFRPSLVAGIGMDARNAQLFFGQGSSAPGSRSWDLAEPTTRRQQIANRLRSRFDVSVDQPGSLAVGENSFLRRWWRARKGSLHNPNRLAKALADPTLTLNGGKALHDSASRGIENLADALRHYGFDRSTLRELIKDDPTFDKLRRFIDLPDSELPNAIRELLDTDLRVTFNTDIARTQGARAQNQLRSMLTWGEKGVNRWGLPASSAGKTAGIGRRIDELRSELVQYFVGTADFRAGGEDFGRIASNFLTRVEDLYSSGAISRVERTEMRTAILGMQVERARSTAYGMMRNIDPSQQKPFTFYDFNMKSIEQIFQTGLDPATTRQLLSEFGSFEEGASFLSAPFRRMGRSFAATDAYETRWLVNPYGTDVLAEPTFQTAFGANPLKAVMGLTGTSWSPEAFSGAAVPATHMVTRLNKYFETFGLGLDPSRYRSPVDMFARGMVGKRIAPTFALGATAYSLDASLGGLLNERDAEGNPVYSPYILGKGATLAAHGQIGLAGLVPGGQTVEEKREELFGSAQVPVRQGRWWLFGNQPWEGGRIQYFRPSWYQRFKAGGAFTPEMNETPMERLAFGYDFSPLRPLDPYRFERQNAASRPYPVSGDYFTGPYGPITPLLNQTVGRILKPRRQLVSDEALQFYAQQYQRVGDQGAYMSPTPALAAGPMSAINTGYMNAGIGTGSANVLYPAMGYAPPRGRASQEVRGRTEALGQMYSQAAANPGSYVGVYQSLSPYGVPIARGSGISPRIISSEPMVDYGSVGNQMRRFGYTTQEMAGIYGFAFGSLRQGMGWGGQDFNQTAAMLQPASQGYSSARAFWNLNIGGLGDIPLGVSSGGIGNLEISEIIRRFVPREPTNDYVNPLPNLLGQQHPWLPGANYPINPIKMGDPYNIPDAVYRLPGTGFSRTNLTFGSPDNLGIANVHQILGDIAPWSEEYRAANNLVNRADLSPLEQALVNRTRAQVEAKRFENEFTPYVYRYQSSGEMMKHPISYGVGRLGEWLTHRDTFYNSKFMRTRTAVEDWERDNVYGATYPSWSSPISSFVEPALSRSTQRNPVAAALTLGFAGRFFGRTRQAQLTGTIVGGATGLAGSLYGTAYESITGNRFIPKERRQQIALEEYVDMLSYVRAGVNAARSAQMGDMQAAQDFMFQASRTMYGANLNSTPEELAMSIPDRKREHFRAMLFAPEEEREQILSTAGRLERRLFQAAWGMPVEELPDLREYFEEHELPGLDSGFWDPNVDMDNIKIKIGQSLGMDMAQMGFYPQQIREANLINPIYPEMMRDSGRIPGDMSTILMQLQIMAARQGGSVQRIPIPYGGDRFELNAGTW